MNFIKNMFGITVFTAVMIVFSSLFLRACDKEYDNQREFIQEYKQELKK